MSTLHPRRSQSQRSGSYRGCRRFPGFPRFPRVRRFRAPLAAAPTLLALVVAGTAAGGCDVVGPAAIRNSRGNYNAAVQETGKEQLLLNVVRMRYDDPPLFFDVTAVSSQLSFGVSAGGSASLPQQPNARSYGLSAGTSFTDSPTVTYVPMQGDNLVKQMMSPISLEVITSLYRAGWDIDTLLALTVDRLGTELCNTTTSTGNGKFDQVRKQFRRLQDLGALDLAVRKADTVDHKPDGRPLGPDELTFIIDPYAADESCRDAVFEAEAALRKLLPESSASTRPSSKAPSAADAANVFVQQFSFRSPGCKSGQSMVDTPPVRTRSVMGALAFAAVGVCVPPRDKAAVDDRETPGPDRVPAMKIRCGSSAPGGAYAAVPYRGHWFYIPDDDPATKRAFAVLTQVMTAQGSGMQNTGLLLTLPVSK